MLRSFLTLITLQLLNCRPGNSQADPSEAVKLRLANGQSRCAGRVEIHYKGQWGTVDHDLWDQPDAGVVCGELGCGTALSAPGGAHFGEGSGPIVTYNVQCKGSETALRDCRSVPWDHYGFSHSNDAGVICSAHRFPKLVFGAFTCSGRLEIHSNIESGTVCDLDLDWNDARVVCAELQCGVAISVRSGAYFGEGAGLIWNERFECKGGETGLTDCTLVPVTRSECTHRNDVSVICSDENWSLRLTNGGSRCDGRVEIYHNHSWGRVQDSLWDLNDANVACRQLGCGEAEAAFYNSKYGEGEGSVWVNDVRCEGNESHLRKCSTFILNPNRSDSIGVGVLCSEHKQLRLSGGGSRCAGRLEIYHNGTWGSVCDDSWDLTDADVVCKQLDCGHALRLPLHTSAGPDADPIWLDELECSGSESFLWECPHALWGNHDCNHKEDVKIMCSEHKELRLVKGKHRCEGRVEVFYNGTWGTVCSENLYQDAGTVICKQLGCGTFVSIDYDARSFGEGSGPIWLDEVECLSHESTLWQCQADPWGQHNCHHREDAGVVCSGGDTPKQEQDSANGCKRESGQSLRLAGGNNNCSGRLEVLCNRAWGTVCDDSWDMNDASVVCRQLGCGSALEAAGGAAFGQGNGPVWLDEVKCTGSEAFLFDCPSSSLAQADCDHKEDASVICSGPELSPTSPSTPSGHEDESTSIPLVICISLGVLLICELIALLAVMQRRSSINESAAASWDPPSVLYQAIYEEIDNIPPAKLYTQSRASVSSTIDSFNHVEYYTSHSLGDTDPGSEYPEVESSSCQVPALSDYDDAEAETIDSHSGHLLLNRDPDGIFTLTSSSGDLGTLGHSHQQIQDVTSSDI
ncbi:scavenger receptor cysteine-rich domain-containing protein DMBT1-like isoform X3 [Mustelus asterias]